jgi:hypothetical protein
MKHVFFALAAATLLMTSSGCGLGDRMFGCHKPWGGCNGCDCGNGGGCGDGASCANCGAHGDPGGGYANDGHPPHNMLPRGVGGTYVGPQGPPTGAVAYPYYTNHGPRDFLDANPPSIGP